MGAELKWTKGFKLHARLESPVKELHVGFKGENAQKAHDNEYGVGHIPPRPFMRKFARDVRNGLRLDKIQEFGGKADYLQVTQIGAILVSDLQEIIEDWSKPPNAPLTIKIKGFNNPLIHTREMIQSADYWVKFRESAGTTIDFYDKRLLT